MYYKSRLPQAVGKAKESKERQYKIFLQMRKDRKKENE